MIFVFHGNDFEKRNHQKNNILEVLKKKRSDSNFIKISDEDFDENFLKQNIQSAGLFDEKSIFEISGCFSKKENEILFQEYLIQLNESDNAFIFSEEKISIKTKNLLSKGDYKVYPFEKTGVKNQANLFEISDLFLSRDKKNIWIKYREFINSGTSEEELFGILFWSIKSMNIVFNSNDISETNIKPFVYNKNKRFSEKWTKKELDSKMLKMINVYHDSRRGLVDFKVELEKIILE